MNIESTNTATITKSTEASTSSSSASTASMDNSTSFKEQLEVVKTQDNKVDQKQPVEANESGTTPKKAEEVASNNSKVQPTSEQPLTNVLPQQVKSGEVASNNIKKQEEKNKLDNKKTKTSENLKNEEIFDPITELSSKIATLNELKNGSHSKIHEIVSKTEETTDKCNYCQIIKMDNNDAAFFVNLVQNQQMSAQSAQANNPNSPTNTLFTDVKAEATQSTVQVSATLLNALNDSAKTGKSFRIDFGSDVAVIMKVDKEGVLSANFIPGTVAVENYLKNNIAGLRQTFEEQNLPYNQLSYSNQQKQEQREKQSKNNKENEHE